MAVSMCMTRRGLQAMPCRRAACGTCAVGNVVVGDGQTHKIHNFESPRMCQDKYTIANPGRPQPNRVEEQYHRQLSLESLTL